VHLTGKCQLFVRRPRILQLMVFGIELFTIIKTIVFRCGADEQKIGCDCRVGIWDLQDAPVLRRVSGCFSDGRQQKYIMV